MTPLKISAPPRAMLWENLEIMFHKKSDYRCLYDVIIAQMVKQRVSRFCQMVQTGGGYDIWQCCHVNGFIVGFAWKSDCVATLVSRNGSFFTSTVTKISDLSAIEESTGFGLVNLIKDEITNLILNDKDEETKHRQQEEEEDYDDVDFSAQRDADPETSTQQYQFQRVGLEQIFATPSPLWLG